MKLPNAGNTKDHQQFTIATAYFPIIIKPLFVFTFGRAKNQKKKMNFKKFIYIFYFLVKRTATKT